MVPFLERELVDTLPYVVASTLTAFSASLVDEVLDVLCWQLLPFTGKTSFFNSIQSFYVLKKLHSIFILIYISFGFGLFSVCIDRTSDNFVLPSTEDVPGLNESGEGIQNSVALADSILSRSSYASYSASAILMMVFQFVTDNSAIQRKVTECLMALKDDLVKVINHV